MVVEGSTRTLLLAALTVSVALAGCADVDDDVVEVPDLTNMTSVPEEEPFQWPECHLVAGDISWTSFEGAPRPDGPTTATLKTDAFGVTHIYADDLYSLFYANGFVQARDRLLQIDILRQVGYGESAQYIGESQLGLDFSVHRDLYTREEIQAQYDAAPEEGKQVLQAYADGVNRFMEEAQARDQWPGEFAALSRVPPPWEPVDSVALIDYLIGYFGVDGGSELRNLRHLAQLESTLDQDQAWDAFGDMTWLRAEDTYTSISPEDKILNGCEEPSPRTEVDHQLTHLSTARNVETLGGIGSFEPGVGGFTGPPDPNPGGERGSFYADVDHGIMESFKWGSNAFVADGSITDTGVPIMWGAPQMGYYKPPIPYQIGLHAPAVGFDAVGIGVAGAPGIVIGRNADIAWTATSGIEDQVDLVELNLTDDRSYSWDGEVRDMDCWIVEHQVFPAAGGHQGEPRVYEQEVCRANGWPVVGIDEEAGVAYMAKSTTRNEELMGALKWLQAPTMHSIDEFRELMGDFPFTFNYFVASRDGVAQIHTGDVPLRADGYDPRLPTPSGAAYEWTGEAYTEQMQTWITDPSRGYIANWNNAPVYGWRTGDQGDLWGPVQRVQQIEHWTQQELAKDGTLSFEDIQAINWAAATHDSHALQFLPFLIQAADDADQPDVSKALQDWFALGAPWRDANSDGAYDDPAHAIWDAVQQEMIDRIMGDELGDLTPTLDMEVPQGGQGADHGGVSTRLATLLKALQGNTVHDWCDDIATDEVETCDAQMAAAMTQVVDDLTAEFGSADVSTWLEDVHMNQFIAFGSFTADQRPMVNRGSWVQVVSMAQPERSVSILPPANSGLITSAELAVQQGGGGDPERLTLELDLYWNNQYKPFPLTESEVSAVIVEEETLIVTSAPSLPS